MIVRLHILKSTLFTHECDPNIPVIARKAHDHDGVSWIRVQGKQIKVALTSKEAAQYYNSESWYYFYNDPAIDKMEWSEVKHDHVQLNRYCKIFHPDVDMTYVMRVQGLDEYGNIMVLPHDAVKARLLKNLVKRYASVITGYVHLKPAVVRFV